MSPVVIIILGILLLAGMFWIKTVPADRRGAAVFKMLILLGIAIIVILTVTGRLHWMGAILASFFLLFKKYSGVIRVFPFLRYLFGKHTSGRTYTSTKNGFKMTREDALKVLDLEEGCSSEDIIQAHRKLMQKLHPDRGGNDYLAAQVNEARNVLLNK